jgi:biopolymer transport protein ExbD
MHAGTGGEKAEPNLTPLLDLVLQLVMFFMISANFIMEQVNRDIKLPEAQSALPLDKTVSNVLFLNVNTKGEMEVPGGAKKVLLKEIEQYLRTEWADDVRRSGGTDKVRTKIAFRADKDTKVKDVYPIWKLCQSIGYRNLELRAVIDSKGTAK